MSEHQKWEYFQIANPTRLMDGTLDRFGQEGWELVSVTSPEDGPHPHRYIFKRPQWNLGERA